MESSVLEDIATRQVFSEKTLGESVLFVTESSSGADFALNLDWMNRRENI